MDWATRRRRMVIAILAAAGVAALAILLIAVFYRVPSCTDGRSNGDETGVDCGGSCTRICSIDARPAEVSFSRALTQSGRTDVIAYVRNPNRDAAASNADLSIELYSADGLLVTARTSMYLPPASVVPLFVPGVLDQAYDVQQVFATVDSTAWVRAEEMPAQLQVGDVITRDQATRPRITAVVSNPEPRVAYDVPVVVTVFDAEGNAIAASRTVIDSIPGQGSAPIVFTWNEPWPGIAARVEVMPLPEEPRALGA